MLAIDVPISVLAGMALADAGRDLLREGGREGSRTMRNTVLLYTFIFLTPIPFYFFLGWPAWETNFLWQWPDSLLDSPAKAAGVAFGVFILTAGPAYLGLKIAALLIRKGLAAWVRIGYAALAALVGVIVFLTRDITFNIASTHAKFEAGQFYSFWSHPFFAGWLIVTVYFWGSLAICYWRIRKAGLTLKVRTAIV
jgi:hypothetical protein